ALFQVFETKGAALGRPVSPGGSGTGELAKQGLEHGSLLEIDLAGGGTTPAISCVRERPKPFRKNSKSRPRPWRRAEKVRGWGLHGQIVMIALAPVEGDQ